MQSGYDLYPSKYNFKYFIRLQSACSYQGKSALSQSGEISPDFCCFYGGGIRHNENIMHSFQNFIVRLIPNHPPPLETTIWKLVVRALGQIANKLRSSHIL